MASISIPSDELWSIVNQQIKGTNCQKRKQWLEELKLLCDIGIINSQPIHLDMKDVKKIGFDEFK